MFRSLFARLGYAAARSGKFDKTVFVQLQRIADFVAREKDCQRLGIGCGLPHREVLGKLSPETTVLHGPFAGMKYPGLNSVGSALAAKFIGSYECELHALVEELCAKRYPQILDIGCAEGYYAVGFALRSTESCIFAFDINAEARTLCRQMASLNLVRDRVQVLGICDPQSLIKTLVPGRALLFSDCEGYELELFSDEVVQKLTEKDILIEVHDFINPVISSTLLRRFRETHELSRFKSIPDIERPRRFCSPQTAGLSEASVFQLMAEQRPGQMEWFFFRALTKAG